MSITYGPKIPQLFVSAALGDQYYTAGEALLRGLQALVEPNVISVGALSAPPPTPSDGDSYIVGASPTGAWAGQANNFAYWSTDNPSAPNGEWEFYTPLNGWIVGSGGAIYTFNGTAWSAPITGGRVAAIPYVIDGGGSVPSTGLKGQLSIPAGCTITGWVLTSDVSGSAVVDVLRSTYAAFPTTASIAGTDMPTLSSAQKNQDLVLTGWGSTAINAGDEIQFNLVSVTTVTRLNITLNVTIP
jgi:hypothetical protein